MAKFSSGASGNPGGRPKGRPDRRSRLRRELENEGGDVVKALLAAAKGGDVQACRIVLDRICPALRPVDPPQTVKADGESLTEIAVSIVKESLAGRLSAAIAKELTGALAAVGRIKELDEFEARLREIESRLPPPPA